MDRSLIMKAISDPSAPDLAVKSSSSILNDSAILSISLNAALFIATLSEPSITLT